MSSLLAHLDRIGGREAHQLAGTQGCLVCFVTVSKSWRCSAAPPGHHNSHHLHKEDGKNPLPHFVQGEPSVVVSSHQEESHSSPPFVDFHIGEHRTGFPQQTQAAEVGLQTIPISFGRFAGDYKSGPPWMPSRPVGVIRFPGT